MNLLYILYSLLTDAFYYISIKSSGAVALFSKLRITIQRGRMRAGNLLALISGALLNAAKSAKRFVVHTAHSLASGALLKIAKSVKQFVVHTAHALASGTVMSIGKASILVRNCVAALYGMPRMIVSNWMSSIRETVQVVSKARLRDRPNDGKTRTLISITANCLAAIFRTVRNIHKTGIFLGFKVHVNTHSMINDIHKTKTDFISQATGSASAQSPGEQKTQIDLSAVAQSSVIAQKQAEQKTELKASSVVRGNTETQKRTIQKTKINFGSRVLGTSLSERRGKQFTKIILGTLVKGRTASQKRAVQNTEIVAVTKVRGTGSAQKGAVQKTAVTVDTLVKGETTSQKKTVQKTAATTKTSVKGETTSQSQAKQKTKANFSTHTKAASQKLNHKALANTELTFRALVKAALDRIWNGSAIVKVLTTISSRAKLVAEGNRNRASEAVQIGSEVEIETYNAKNAQSVGSVSYTPLGRMAVDGPGTAASVIVGVATGALMSLKSVATKVYATVAGIVSKTVLTVASLAMKTAAVVTGAASGAFLKIGGLPASIKGAVSALLGHSLLKLAFGELRVAKGRVGFLSQTGLHIRVFRGGIATKQGIFGAAVAKIGGERGIVEEEMTIGSVVRAAMEGNVSRSETKAIFSGRSYLSVYSPSDWEYPVLDGERLRITQVFLANQDGTLLSIS